MPVSLVLLLALSVEHGLETLLSVVLLPTVGIACLCLITT